MLDKILRQGGILTSHDHDEQSVSLIRPWRFVLPISACWNSVLLAWRVFASLLGFRGRGLFRYPVEGPLNGWRYWGWCWHVSTGNLSAEFVGRPANRYRCAIWGVVLHGALDQLSFGRRAGILSTSGLRLHDTTLGLVRERVVATIVA